MSYRALEFTETRISPGKVEDDAAILNTVAELARGCRDSVMDARSWHRRAHPAGYHLCDVPGRSTAPAVGDRAERSDRSGVAIRSCYRDLLASGLARAGGAPPAGALVDNEPLDPRETRGPRHRCRGVRQARRFACARPMTFNASDRAQVNRSSELARRNPFHLTCREVLASSEVLWRQLRHVFRRATRG